MNGAAAVEGEQRRGLIERTTVSSTFDLLSDQRGDSPASSALVSAMYTAVE